VKNAKAGQVQYRADKAGIIQCTIGRASFTPDQRCASNLGALIEALNRAKPAGSKGIYLEGSLSSTMGPGVRVDQSVASLRQ
jgi:large subunit ribosomal protein L1